MKLNFSCATLQEVSAAIAPIASNLEIALEKEFLYNSYGGMVEKCTIVFVCLDELEDNNRKRAARLDTTLRNKSNNAAITIELVYGVPIDFSDAISKKWEECSSFRITRICEELSKHRRRTPKGFDASKFIHDLVNTIHRSERGLDKLPS